MEQPRVSLVASVYRGERYLPAWLQNMSAQVIWRDAELILVANDLQPGEREVVAPFAAAHPQVRVVEVDREPLYRSWNRAIALAQAPLLAIANVDDLRAPEGLERQVRDLEDNQDALFSYGGFEITDSFPPAGQPLAAVDPPAFDRETFTSGMHVGPFLVWRATGRRATEFFDEGLRSGSDMDFAIRLAFHGRGLKAPCRLGWYYDGGTGLSTAGALQRVERAVLCLRYGMFDELDLDQLPEVSRYCVPELVMPDGARLPVADAVPGYDALLAARRRRWNPPGHHRRRIRRNLGQLRMLAGRVLRRVRR
jgi:hypothetical protein